MRATLVAPLVIAMEWALTQLVRLAMLAALVLVGWAAISGVRWAWHNPMFGDGKPKAVEATRTPKPAYPTDQWDRWIEQGERRAAAGR